MKTLPCTRILISLLSVNAGVLWGAPNVVIYTDAFTDFKADVRYTYPRAGFEQDIR
jgi:hypothetical protein